MERFESFLVKIGVETQKSHDQYWSIWREREGWGLRAEYLEMNVHMSTLGSWGEKQQKKMLRGVAKEVGKN